MIQDVEFWSSDVVVGKPNNVQAADWVRVVSGAHAGFVGQVVLISKEGEAKIAAPGDTYGTVRRFAGNAQHSIPSLSRRSRSRLRT